MLIQLLPRNAQQLVSTQEQYDAWLKTVNDGDYVLLQRFVVPNYSLEIPIECFRYEKVKVRREGGVLEGKLIECYSSGSNTVPLMEDGHATFWNNDTENNDTEISGHVFGDRLVPYVAGICNSGGLGFAFNPVFEPAWTEGFNYRFLYTDRTSLPLLIEKFPRHYRQSTCDGMLFVGFDSTAEIDTAALESGSCRFLYSNTNC